MVRKEGDVYVLDREGGYKPMEVDAINQVADVIEQRKRVYVRLQQTNFSMTGGSERGGHVQAN